MAALHPLRAKGADVSAFKRVSELQPGETIMLARTDDGAIHWPLGYRLGTTAAFALATIGDVSDGELKLYVDGAPHTSTYSEYQTVEVINAHHPVCGDCGEMWPCRDDRRRAEADRFAHRLDDMCAHCGKEIAVTEDA